VTDRPDFTAPWAHLMCVSFGLSTNFYPTTLSTNRWGCGAQVKTSRKVCGMHARQTPGTAENWEGQGVESQSIIPVLQRRNRLVTIALPAGGPAPGGAVAFLLKFEPSGHPAGSLIMSQSPWPVPR